MPLPGERSHAGQDINTTYYALSHNVMRSDLFWSATYFKICTEVSKKKKRLIVKGCTWQWCRDETIIKYRIGKECQWVQKGDETRVGGIMIQGLRRKDGDEWAMMLQKHELESRNKKRVCAEWWQPSHSSTCGGTDWTRRRAFWLPWRPSVSWQMAASKRRAPGRPQFPLIGSPRTHSTPHAHMHRLLAYEKGEGEWRTWLFWSQRCQASPLLMSAADDS